MLHSKGLTDMNIGEKFSSRTIGCPAVTELAHKKRVPFQVPRRLGISNQLIPICTPASLLLYIHYSMLDIAH